MSQSRLRSAGVRAQSLQDAGRDYNAMVPDPLGILKTFSTSTTGGLAPSLVFFPFYSWFPQISRIVHFRTFIYHDIKSDNSLRALTSMETK